MAPFEPDGVFAGIPYRALPDGTIEAMMPGGLVKFKDVDQIVAVANGTPAFSIVTTQAIVPHDQVARWEGNGGPKVPDYQSLLLDAVKNNSHNSSERLPVVQQQEQFRRGDQSGYSSMSLIDLMRHIHEMALVVARIEAERIRDQSERAYSEQIGSSASARPFPARTADSSIPARLVAQPSSASEPHSQSGWEDTNDQTHPPEETNYQTHRRNAVEQSQTDNQHYAEPTDDQFIDDQSDQEQSESVDTTSSPSRELQILSPASTPPLYQAPHSLYRLEEFPDARRPEEVVLYARGRNLFYGLLIFAILFVGTVFIAGTLWHSSKLTSSPESSSTSNPNAESKRNNSREAGSGTIDNTPKLPFPIPKSYGVYALTNEKLVELKTLPTNVPDPRVAISAEIKKPSTATISGGKPAFLLFRRDLLNNAPQKLTVRVVARMMRETTFVNGKATVRKIEGAWRIRSKAYDLRVSPVPGQREMIIARLADNASLPAGRYALVLNRVGYDFTVDGAITSPIQCIELFETTNGPIFSECRNPK